jgi:hypothetical protein
LPGSKFITDLLAGSGVIFPLDHTTTFLPSLLPPPQAEAKRITAIAVRNEMDFIVDIIYKL